MNRITGSNVEESIHSRLVDNTLTNESLSSRVFYFGQVISNTDPNNLNRIKVRIPKLDDVYYVNVSKAEGDATLPICVPFNNRFLDVPEVNSIVLVAVFDTKVPYLGRMYFDSFSDFSSSDYFTKMTPEQALLSNWGMAEDIFGIKINSKPTNPDQLNTKNNINYKTGIRGKGNNKVLLDKDYIEISQNLNADESKIRLSKDIDIDSSDKINIISTKGYATHYHPVFDNPLFDYFSALNDVVKKIITVLNTEPAISPAGPCMPSPQGKKLVAELKQLSKKFAEFKKNGSSKKIQIN